MRKTIRGRARSPGFLRLRVEAARFRALATRYRHTFEAAPVPLWHEDFSDVATWLESLPDTSSPAAVRSFLQSNPEALDRGISLIRVLELNPGAADMVNLGRGKALFGGDPADPVTSEVRTAVIEQLVAVSQGESTLEVPINGLTRSGDTVHAVLYWQAARTETGAADYSEVMVAIVDISERVEAELRLEDIIRSKNQLIASISHELRTPLTSVLGFAQVLRDPERLAEGEWRQMLALIINEAEDLNAIVEDLLVAARIESSELEVSRVPVSMSSQITQVTERLRDVDADTIELDAGSATAEGDPRRVRQILRNLIINAVRYGGENIRISADERGSMVVVRVTDDGPGIPEEDRTRVFDPYHQVADQAEQPGSIGLGLTISRNLARLMGGDLTLDCDNGETTFELTLPSIGEERSAPVPEAVQPSTV